MATNTVKNNDANLNSTSEESPLDYNANLMPVEPESMLDYSEPDALNGAGNALANSGLQVQFRISEDNHAVSWKMNLPENAIFLAGLHQYIRGINARVHQANIDTGKDKPMLDTNPRAYTLYRVVTRMHNDRVMIADYDQADSGVFRIATFARNEVTGQFFRLPAKLMCVEEFALFARYDVSLSGKRGLVYAASLVTGELFDAMEAGKGYNVDFRANSRTALEKAYRVSNGFLVYSRTPVTAWNKLARKAESGESGKQNAG